MLPPITPPGTLMGHCRALYASLPGMAYSTTEYRFINAVLDSPTADAPRVRYAEWLLTEGDEARSKVVQATRLGSLDRVAVEAALSALGAEHLGWSRLVGAQLIREACALDLERFVERWLGLARPALELVIGHPSGDMPVGASRLWGDPDLPSDAAWPTLADCRRWEPDIDLPEESRCQFVAQINLAELAGSPAARELPSTGLLSVFSHHEWENTGSSSICLRYFETAEGLHRVPHPPADQDNTRVAPHLMELREVLTIPEWHGSPFAAEMGVDDGDWDTGEKHRQVMLASGGDLLGLLGHDRCTTGDDPTPDRDWERLITVPVDAEAIVIQHLSIRQANLRAAQLQDHKLVWVDFDGA